MKRLIVNADDFGLTEKVNQGIIEGHRNGIITSTTLLANGAAFESAVKLARGAGRLGVGVHLNLVEGRPVLEGRRVPSLVNREGAFGAGPVGLGRRIVTGQVRLAEAEAELRAQIEKVLAAGIRPTHLDGHKHAHMLPRVFDVVVKLASAYELKGVRCAGERAPWPGELMRRHPRGWARIFMQHLAGRGLSILLGPLRARLERAGLGCPENFLGITETGFLDGERVKKILENLAEGTSELMCHPGYVDAELEHTPTRLLRQREEELEALTQPELRGIIAERNIELIHYGDLRGTT